MKKAPARKPVIQLIKEDIVDNYKAILAVMIGMGLLQYVFHTICMLKVITGLPCPACGLTRGCIRFLKMDVCGAIRWNPMVPFIMIGICLWLVMRYIVQRQCRWLTYYGIVVLIGLFVIYFIRIGTDYPLQAPLDYHPRNLVSLIRSIIK